MTAIKRCNKCGVEYPATKEHFHGAQKNPDGLRTECKLCRQKDTQHYREVHRKELREKQGRYMKTDRGQEQRKRYLETNQEALAEYKKRYYDANRDQILKQKKFRRAENPELFREHNRLRRLANPELHRERYRKWHEAIRNYQMLKFTSLYGFSRTIP